MTRPRRAIPQRLIFFFSSRRRHTRFKCDWSSDVCSSDLNNADAALPPRNSRTRERERHLLLYLQRVAAKNDTFSEFGPSGWGKISKSVSEIGRASCRERV